MQDNKTKHSRLSCYMKLSYGFFTAADLNIW